MGGLSWLSQLGNLNGLGKLPRLTRLMERNIQIEARLNILSWRLTYQNLLLSNIKYQTDINTTV